MTFRRVIFPMSIPAVVAGSIFTFSLTLGDYIVPGLVSTTQFIGNVIVINVAQDLPFAAAYSLVPLVDHARSTCSSRGASAHSRRSDDQRSGRALGLRLATAFVLVFIYVPLALVVIYAFNESGTSAWPPAGLHDEVDRRGHRQHRPSAGVPHVRSVRTRRDDGRDGAGRARLAGCVRYRASGARRSPSSDPAPIALPGVVTGMALSTTFASLHVPLGIPDGRWSGTRRSASCSSTTTRSPGCAGCQLVRGGVGRPRRRCLPDIPVRDVPVAPVRPDRRRHCWRSPCRSMRSSSRSSRPVA